MTAGTGNGKGNGEMRGPSTTAAKYAASGRDDEVNCALRAPVGMTKFIAMAARPGRDDGM